MAHDKIRAFNKRYLNRFMLKFAGNTPTILAILHHVGRTSGKLYSTPIFIERVRGGFVIALTYGTEIDWYRNVVAAGGCTVRWHSRDYTLIDPKLIPRKEGIRAFPLPMRFIMGVIGIGPDDFLSLRVKKQSDR